MLTRFFVQVTTPLLQLQQDKSPAESKNTSDGSLPDMDPTGNTDLAALDWKLQHIKEHDDAQEALARQEEARLDAEIAKKRRIRDAAVARLKKATANAKATPAEIDAVAAATATAAAKGEPDSPGTPETPLLTTANVFDSFVRLTGDSSDDEEKSPSKGQTRRHAYRRSSFRSDFEEMSDDPRIMNYAQNFGQPLGMPDLTQIPAFKPFPKPTTDPEQIAKHLKDFDEHDYKARFPLPDGSGTGYDRHKDMAEMEAMVSPAPLEMQWRSRLPHLELYSIT